MWRMLANYLTPLIYALAPVTTASAGEVQRVPVYLQENQETGGRLLPVYRNLEELLSYLEIHSEVQFERIRVPWDRAKNLALEGRGLIWGFSKSRERLSLYDYSETVVQLPIWAISAQSGAKPAQDIEDLRGQLICARRGISLGLDYEKAKTQIFRTDEEHSNFAQMFRKLSTARCDYLFWSVQRIEQRHELELYLHKKFIPGLKVPELLDKKFVVSARPLLYDTLHFATGRGYWHDVLERLDQAIRKGRQSGEIERILQRWE